MAKPVQGIQPAVLRWARESQGLTIDDVAKLLKRTADEIEAWETEPATAAPTYSQLEALAYKHYKRPLAIFFLPAPPRERPLNEQFRTLPDFKIGELSADTRYNLRLGDAFKQALAELNDGVNPAPRKIFRDIRLSKRAHLRRSALRVREYLGIPLEAQLAWTSPEEALKTWRIHVEKAGVFVFKRAFKQAGVSGFCLADDEFPIIYLNNSTAKTRQIFTLMHELAHLLLGGNAITLHDDSYITALSASEMQVEIFCNALAAEILVPSEDFKKLAATMTVINDKAVESLAERYCVSREAIFRRFLDLGHVTRTEYEIKSKKWSESKGKTKPGGNYYLTQATYLGETYLSLVFGKLYQGRLSQEQAAEYLGVKTKNLAGLEEVALKQRGAG